MADAGDEIGRLLVVPGADGEEPDLVGADAPLHPRAEGDLHRRAAHAEPDAPRVEHLRLLRPAEGEDRRALGEEGPLLGEEEREAGEVHHLPVHLGLREVGEDGEVGRERVGDRHLHVEPGGEGARGCGPQRLGAVGVEASLAQSPLAEDERTQLGACARRQRTEALDRPLLLEEAIALAAAPRAPEHFLVRPREEAAEVHPHRRDVLRIAQRRPRDEHLGAPAALEDRRARVPDAVPLLVPALEGDVLTVPERAVGVGAEVERAPLVAEAVDHQADVVVGAELGVATQL
jgi:hypothetical protein